MYFAIPVVNHPNNGDYWFDLYHTTLAVTKEMVEPYHLVVVRPEAAVMEFLTRAVLQIDDEQFAREELLTIQKIAYTQYLYFMEN
jgi:hypothetical protein